MKRDYEGGNTIKYQLCTIKGLNATRAKMGLKNNERSQPMTKLMHGIVHGKTIELTEDLGLSDGQSVELIVMPSGSSQSTADATRSEVSPKRLPGPPPEWKPSNTSATAGLLAEEWTEEDDRILDQIYADRKAAKWRDLPE
jgi:hypothetical protein